MPNSSAAETQNNNHEVDFLSNGFKVRTANGGINASGDVYLYMAFAEKSGNTPYQTETTAR